MMTKVALLLGKPSVVGSRAAVVGDWLLAIGYWTLLWSYRLIALLPNRSIAADFMLSPRGRVVQLIVNI